MRFKHKKGEELAENWSVHGTTGYDYMNAINGVYVERSNETVLFSVFSQFL
jgi:(1->4)-alpha-D-glucan 1-alpha-D-glucosylmutase